MSPAYIYICNGEAFMTSTGAIVGCESVSRGWNSEHPLYRSSMSLNKSPEAGTHTPESSNYTEAREAYETPEEENI